MEQNLGNWADGFAWRGHSEDFLKSSALLGLCLRLLSTCLSAVLELKCSSCSSRTVKPPLSDGAVGFQSRLVSETTGCFYTLCFLSCVSQSVFTWIFTHLSASSWIICRWSLLFLKFLLPVWFLQPNYPLYQLIQVLWCRNVLFV